MKHFYARSITIFSASLAVFFSVGAKTVHALGFWDVITSPDLLFAEIVRLLIFEPSAWIVRGAAYVFDFVVPYSLGIAAEGVPNIFGSAFVAEGWGIMRDVTTIAFIFAMLYIAIATILQIGAGRNTNALLVRIVIIALLINFSLFFAEVIIDGANLLAIEFYEVLSANNEHGLAAIFMSGFNPQKLLSVESFDDWITEYKGEYSVLIVIYLFGGIIQLISAYMIFWAAFLFIARIVVLWITMIVAPLAFAAYIFPPTALYFNKWWSNLFKQSFIAPVFLFFFFILALFIQNGLRSFVTGAAARTGEGGIVSIIFEVVLGFSLVASFLFFILKQTKQIGGQAAALADKSVGYAKKVGGFAVGAGLALASGGTSLAAGLGGRTAAAALRGRAFGAAGRGAGAVLEPKGGVGRTLRAIPGAGRVAAGIETRAKQGIKTQIGQYEKRLKPMSNAALETIMQSVGPAEEKAAAMQILGERKNLKPKELGGNIDIGTIDNALDALKNRGYNVKENIEKKYAWQYAYAQDKGKREEAIKSVGAENVGNLAPEYFADPEILRIMYENWGPEHLQKVLNLGKKKLKERNEDGTVKKDAEGKDVEKTVDLTDEFFGENLKTAMQKHNAATLQDYFTKVGNRRAAIWARGTAGKRVANEYNYAEKGGAAQRQTIENIPVFGQPPQQLPEQAPGPGPAAFSQEETDEEKEEEEEEAQEETPARPAETPGASEPPEENEEETQ